MGNLTVKESGEMVNIISPNVSKITSFKVHFSPKQEGTGDPSPENVREIVGWNGVDGYKCGKNMAHIFGYGTQTITDTDVNKYKTTNVYGTTINTTIFNNPDTPLIIEQSQAPNSTTPSTYHNGYIVIGTDNLVFGQKYNVSFKVSNITNNILNISLNNIKLLVPTGTTKSVTEIIDDVLIFKNVTFYQSTIAPKRQSFEIRICGLSFTLSEFMVTAVDNDDFTYEPYQGNIYSKEWTKNLLDIWEKPNGYKPSSYTNGNYDWSKEWIVTDELKGKTITYSTFIDNTNANGNGYVHIWTKNSEGNYIKTGIIPSSNKQIIAGESGWSYVNLILTDDIYSVIFGITVSANAIAKYPMVELGSEPTEYQPYVGDVYGGYVDLVSGELVSSWICSKIKDLDGTWSYRSSNKRFQITLQSNFANTDATTWSRFAIAEAYKKSTVDGYANGQIATYINKHIYIRDDSFDGDVEAFLEAVGDTKVAYELAESTTYQLTPTQLSTLKGQNNFWSNADYVEIEYELTETFDIQKAKRKIILNQPHVETVSGDIVTFDTDMKGKLKECKVYFSPMQEGEGDPSPDNVRNIVGWNGVKVGLPDEYQEVEYIESTGTQYIDTGVTLGTNDFTILFNFEQTEHTSGEQPITSIWTISYNYWNLFIRSISSDKYVLDVYTSAHHMLSTEVNLNEKYTVSLTRNENSWELKQKDSTITWTYSSSKINNTTLKLFKRGDLSTGHSTHIKMYSFKMTISNTRTLNLIPCYRKSDGEIGMYDTVSKQFFTNQGMDTFLKGDDVDGIQASIDWTNDVDTVYSGYVDLVSGELVVEYDTVRLEELNWSITNDSSRIRTSDLSGNIAPPPSISKQVDIIGEQVQSASYNMYLSSYPNAIACSSTGELIKYYNGEMPNGLMVYKLAEPIHYQLTPQQILTLKGINNVYSSANGQTEIKYWKH